MSLSMSGPPRPFRPRAETAADPVESSLATVRTQLRRLRVRANVVAAQSAAYELLAVVLALFAVTVLFALALRPFAFAVAIWTIAVLLLFAAFAIARDLRKRWISRRDAAVAVDHRVRLEDRLATLAASGPAERRSPLWTLLLRQNVTLLPRWEPVAVVPRVVPATALLLLASLLFFLGILRWSGIGLGRPRLAAATAGSAGEQPTGDGPEVEGPSGETPGAAPSLVASLPEKLREAILRSAGRLPKGGLAGKGAPRGPAGAAVEGTVTDGQPTGGTPSKARSSRPGAAGSGDGESLAQGSERKANAGAGAAGKGSSPGRELASQPMVGDAPKPLPPVESGKARAGGEKEKLARAGAGRGGGGSGAGSGGDAAGLYGPRAAGDQPGGFFPLDLAAESAQQGNDPDEAPPSRPSTQLSNDQRLDDTIRRAQVPPEYERIVQRLYSRPEE
jgi:hypothetical protein